MKRCPVVMNDTGSACNQPTASSGDGLCAPHVARRRNGWADADLGLPWGTRRARAAAGPRRVTLIDVDQTFEEASELSTSWHADPRRDGFHERLWQTYCAKHKLTLDAPYPVEVIVAYLTWLWEPGPPGPPAGYRANTVRAAASWLSRQHTMLGYPSPTTAQPVVDLLAGMDRHNVAKPPATRGGPPGRRRFLTREDMRRIAALAPPPTSARQSFLHALLLLRTLPDAPGIADLVTLDAASTRRADGGMHVDLCSRSLHLPHCHDPLLDPCRALEALLAVVPARYPLATLFPKSGAAIHADRLDQEVIDRAIRARRVQLARLARRCQHPTATPRANEHDIGPHLDPATLIHLAASSMPPWLQHLRDLALVLTTWQLALRPSDLHSLVFGLNACRSHDGWTIAPARLKSDQRFDGAPLRLQRAEDPRICAVTALDRWVLAAALSHGDQLFPVLRNGVVAGHLAMSASTRSHEVSELFRRAGIAGSLG
jgi:hypothetical protein